ncbi:MAG: TrpR YerC/YecD [Clostridiales bacterium]|nr:TrpR YerC/YecD [Clostridiales bacterium]
MSMNITRTTQTDLLVRAFLCMRDEEECYQLLEDLMTIREIQDLAQRLEVAKLLWQKVTYNEIAQRTGVSTATISRVNRSLNYGEGGYEMVFERLGCEDDRPE